MESGLEGSYTYDPPFFTLPNDDRTDLGSSTRSSAHGCHIVVVEVDPETGQVEFLRYVAVHDHGTVVNPRSLQGQIRGGIAQGIGVALYEQVVYGAGRPATSPRRWTTTCCLARRTCRGWRSPSSQTPSPFTERGVKGGGEGGRMIAPPAVTRAVEDALRPFGARIDELPITRDRIVEATGGSEAVPVRAEPHDRRSEPAAPSQGRGAGSDNVPLDRRSRSSGTLRWSAQQERSARSARRQRRHVVVVLAARACSSRLIVGTPGRLGSAGAASAPRAGAAGAP